MPNPKGKNDKTHSELLIDRQETYIPIISLLNCISRRFIFEYKDRGYSEFQASVLSALGLGEGAKSQLELGDATSRTPSSISSICREFEKEGLVQRHKDPGNRKFQMVSLTKKGEQASREMDDEAEELLHELFESLSQKEVKTLIEILAKTVDHIEKKHGLRLGWIQKPR